MNFIRMKLKSLIFCNFLSFSKIYLNVLIWLSSQLLIFKWLRKTWCCLKFLFFLTLIDELINLPFFLLCLIIINIIIKLYFSGLMITLWILSSSWNCWNKLIYLILKLPNLITILKSWNLRKICTKLFIS